jgi:hypothetical protein
MTLHISVPNAAAMLGLPESAIVELAQSGKVHLFET